MKNNLTKARVKTRRSKFTNSLIRELLEDGRNFLIIDDGGEKHTCFKFGEATAVIDSVSDVGVRVLRRTDNFVYGWLQLTTCNDAEEQLVDHTANDYMDSIVDRLMKDVDWLTKEKSNGNT